jgi:hypothetical protein
MKSSTLCAILLVPLALTGCVSAGYVDDSGYVYPSYYYDSPYYGPAVGVYYYHDGPTYGHHYYHDSSSYSHDSSTVAAHSGSHFTGTRTASVSSSGHTSGGEHHTAHVSSSVHHD